MNFSLAPTLYRGADPAGFVAGLPRCVKLHGEAYKILIVTFLTVASQYKRRGYGVVVWNELVTRARDAGFDGMINYCVNREPMDQMLPGFCARAGVRVQ